MEKPDCFNRNQLSIAMRVVKGDFDFAEHDLPEDVALFIGGMAVSGDLQNACVQGILNAYNFDKRGTINLARKIGLDLRKCGMYQKIGVQ